MEFLTPEWWAALLAIIVVDLLLAGDNAVVIALAARDLPTKWRKRAIIWGTFGAIIIRVILVFFVSKLLLLPGVSFVGGLLLYWIAWKLVNEDNQVAEGKNPANSFWAAMSTIIVADTVMGLDNVLAIAGAARGDVVLIVLGLALSIPIMMGGSALILKCIDRMPWLIIAGAALLCGIAGHIVLDDAWLKSQMENNQVELSATVRWVVVLSIAAAITFAATYKKYRNKQEKQDFAHDNISQ
ncbi:MAG: TerC family protein [Proteobacteria bacterium]|nr:TerC family protein [Pseudomonadota bacterium]MCH9758563.1 TerC family protein [Pseudomonadota bacterium]